MDQDPSKAQMVQLSQQGLERLGVGGRTKPRQAVEAGVECNGCLKNSCTRMSFTVKALLSNTE